MAHVAYWRQRLTDRLRALLESEPQPDLEAWETVNAEVFEERRRRDWPNVLADLERAHAAQTGCIERLTDEDLLAFNRYDWVPDGEPLLALVLGSSYEHAQLSSTSSATTSLRPEASWVAGSPGSFRRRHWTS